MTVLMFKPRFADAVRAYTKLQTIRPVRKRPIQVGDHLLLRQWMGLAYRSPQLALGFGRCTAVHPVSIDHGSYGSHIVVAGVRLSVAACHEFAMLDGFEGATAMLAWFEEQHGLPFNGTLICWEKAEALP